jgi:hypothetical protein
MSTVPLPVPIFGVSWITIVTGAVYVLSRGGVSSCRRHLLLQCGE